MNKIKDLTGQKFGRLTPIRYINDKKWLCKCDCGTIIDVRGYSLQSGNTRSCGCLRKETTIKSHTTHGKHNHRLYRIWNDIKNRCYNKNVARYKDWGGRGITICDEWLNDFQVFYDWSMLNGYKEDLTIDRIDNNKGYSPSNCRWITYTTQARNRRSCKYYTINGETHCLKEWCEIYGVKYTTVYARINKSNYSLEKALTL